MVVTSVPYQGLDRFPDGRRSIADMLHGLAELGHLKILFACF